MVGKLRRVDRSALSCSPMAIQLDDRLLDAALTERERRVLARFVTRLRQDLGADLRAVWLYGSRARGDAVLDDSDPDLKSDIDLLVIAEGGHDRYGRMALELAFEIAEEEGDSPSGTRSTSTARSACAIAARSAPSSSRRSIATSWPSRERVRMSPRSEEYMEQARERAVTANEVLAAGHPAPAVSVAYYAMLNAARAALSEEDETRAPIAGPGTSSASAT